MRVLCGILLLAMAACMCGVVGRMAVFAADQASGSQRVFDQAELFSEDEIQDLEAQIAGLRSEMNMDVVVVTTDDADGMDSETYADQYYEDGGFGVGRDLSGVLLLIDMDNRQVQVSTTGDMIRYLTDDRIDAILDDGVAELKNLDYGAAAQSMLSDVEGFYQDGIYEDQYNQDRDTGAVSRYQHRSIRWYEALLAFAVSAFCGAGACLNVKREYAMKHEQQLSANYHMAYRADAKFQYSNLNDALIDSAVLHTLIAAANQSGRGGGFGGGGGGHVSTTHMSGGGHSHGGGGRGF